MKYGIRKSLKLDTLMMVDASGCNLHQRLRKDGDEDKRFATTLQTKIRSPLFKSD